MSLLPYDVNTYLKTKLLADNANASSRLYGYWPNNNLNFVPLNAPEPCDPSGQPLGLVYVRYYWAPNIPSITRYFHRRDRIRFYIMGRDFDKMWSTGERIVEILNPVDRIPEPIGSAAGSKPNNFVYHTWITGSNSMAPIEIGGLASFMLEFEFRYAQYTDVNGNATES